MVATGIQVKVMSSDENCGAAKELRGMANDKMELTHAQTDVGAK